MNHRTLGSLLTIALLCFAALAAVPAEAGKGNGKDSGKGGGKGGGGSGSSGSTLGAPYIAYFVNDPIYYIGDSFVTPGTEPTSTTAPTDTVSAERPLGPVGPTWWTGWGGQVGGTATVMATVWATAPMGTPLTMYWAGGWGCSATAIICWGSANQGPLVLTYVPGTGTPLPGGIVVGGKFTAAPVALQAHQSSSIGTWYDGVVFVEVTGLAGAVLYDSAVHASCVGVNVSTC